VYLALGLIVWWLAPAAARIFVRDAFYEFQAPLVLAQSHLQDLGRYWERHAGRTARELIEANRDLARVNAALNLRVDQLRALENENRRLAQLLDLPSRPEYRTVIARVARRDINSWWQRLTLRRGRGDGVRTGCPVVVGTGIVGRVSEVHLNTCEVQLLSDPKFRISASLDGDERPAIYQGAMNAPLGTPGGIVTHLPSDYNYTPENDGKVLVFTSGIGGVFPGGLFIGTLAGEVAMTAEGLFLTGRVRLNPQLALLEEAAILVPLDPEPALIE
jgi:rod shape-determining protein MreC